MKYMFEKKVKKHNLLNYFKIYLVWYNINNMNEILKQKIDALPSLSGVYIMKNSSGQVIYVGKAKNLKKRAGQYFLRIQQDQKVINMVESVYDMEYYVTPSELDALALESNLIKKHKPYYNILLKDDKSFSYIKVDLKQDFPKFEITRKIKNDRKKYFGPYFAGVSAFEILKTLNLAFPIFTTGLKISKNQENKKSGSSYAFTFDTQNKNKKLSKEEYRDLVNKTVDFLSGNDKHVEEVLTKKMLANAQAQNFEQALLLRERLKLIERMREKTLINVPRDLSLDAFATYSDGINSSISVVVCRQGRIVGIQNFSVLTIAENEGEVLGEFIAQYYQEKLVPEEILVSKLFDFKDELESMLSEKRGSKTFISQPKISIKSKFTQMASQNAKVHLESSLSKQTKKDNSTIGALTRLKEKLGLQNFPKRIECFDISNLGPTNKVASMVVFTNGEKDSKSYRKFKIETVEDVNDFESMREALTRRLNRLEDEAFGPKPDLVVIDGGKGQLGIAHEVFEQFGLSDKIDLISLAKKFEEVYKPNNSFPYMLNRRSQEFNLLVRLRDEAHRFAITFHRSLRQKQGFKSQLDGLKGLGEEREKLLFKKFLSVERIKAASMEELMQIDGIGKGLATKIKNFLNKEEQ